MYNILNQQVLIRELNPQRPCPSLPKHCHMARAANRLQQKMRPKDPKDLTFEVQADCIPNDFLQDDIKVCTGFSMLNSDILFNVSYIEQVHTYIFCIQVKSFMLYMIHVIISFCRFLRDAT